jgi:methyltransferase
VNTAVFVVVTMVALQRLGELVYAAHNTRRLKQRGAVEYGRRHYPLFAALHAGWLIAIVVFVPADAAIRWPPLGLLIILQAARVWIVTTLGAYWTTRIVSLPRAPLVRDGPYRLMRHPNYLVVIGEIALLPLVFGAWRIAVVFSILNLALLAWRRRVEDEALADRRAIAR